LRWGLFFKSLGSKGEYLDNTFNALELRIDGESQIFSGNTCFGNGVDMDFLRIYASNTTISQNKGFDNFTVTASNGTVKSNDVGGLYLSGDSNIVSANHCNSIGIVFSPEPTGDKAAVLKIVANDSEDSPPDIPLTGTGAVVGPGDFTADFEINLPDTLTGLKILSSRTPPVDLRGDANGNGKLDRIDVRYTIQPPAGQR